MKIFWVLWAFIFIAFPCTAISLIKYDPFDLKLTTNKSALDERGKYIIDLIARAKSRNLITLLDIDNLRKAHTYADVDDVLQLTNERSKEEWIYVKYKNIKYINESWLRSPGIEIFREEKIDFIALHDEHVQLHAATTIAFAHRKKSGVKINLATIKDRRRQGYVDHKHLMKVVLRRKAYSADRALFFH
jgi:hypothetical protein